MAKSIEQLRKELSAAKAKAQAAFRAIAFSESFNKPSLQQQYEYAKRNNTKDLPAIEAKYIKANEEYAKLQRIVNNLETGLSTAEKTASAAKTSKVTQDKAKAAYDKAISDLKDAEKKINFIGGKNTYETAYRSASQARDAAVAAGLKVSALPVSKLAVMPSASGTTTNQQVSEGIPLSAYWQIGGANEMYIAFQNQPSNTLQKAAEFQKIFRGLSQQADPSGKYNNMFELLQDKMRKLKYSDGKTPLGVPDDGDIAGLSKIIYLASAANSPDPITWLNSTAQYSTQGTAVVQPDTTPKFNTQIVKSLSMNTWDDAKASLYDTYFSAFGIAPSNDVITKFQNAWNTENQAQTPTTTTKTKTTYKPIIDPKTGKQVKNSAGQLQYETVTSTDVSKTGEGFTKEEQTAFLGDFLKANFPELKGDPAALGGAAKTIYDELVAVHTNNYDKVPTFDKLMPIILDMVGSGSSKAADEILRQYKDGVRKNASSRFMSLAEDFAAGKDAKGYVDNLLRTASSALETDISIDDPFTKQVLNFKDDKGNFRKPNDFELSNLLLNDYRNKFTSTAKNQAVNLFESLASKLGR